MKITFVESNARRRAFEVKLARRSYAFPFAKCHPQPSAADPVEEIFVDRELACEAFTYRLRSGAEGSVHFEQILDYHRDPGYLRKMLLYQLTIEAQKRASQSALSKRELIRRLGTSPAQLYRLLDQTNHSKSIDQMLRLLSVLDCDVDLIVRPKSA